MDTGPVSRHPKQLADLFWVYMQALAVVFLTPSQTIPPSDFSHIVTAGTNVDPLAQQVLIRYKCAFSMQGMCTRATPLAL